MQKLLLGTVCAVALSAALAGGAMAAAVTGTLGVSYADVTNGGGGSVWGVNGSLQDQFNGNWGVEAAGGYHSASPGGLNVWNAGGSLFWTGSMGRIAGTYSYHNVGPGNFSQYGAGGDWFVASNVTLSAKGGGISGSGVNGGYGGGQVAWYIIPNLALTGSYDSLSISSSTLSDETVKAEWLFSQTTPVSAYLGYQHIDQGGGADVIFVGVILYMDGPNAGTLVDRQRTGSLGYISQSPLNLDVY